MVSLEEGQLLLQFVGETMASKLFDRPQPSIDFSANLQKSGGAFVSLHKRGRLRGCMGRLTSIDPLWKTVEAMALESAFSDPRFSPVQADEWEELAIEISLISPLHKIENWEEIEVGTHGLYIIKGDKRGVLLPQVAIQFNWNREEFLAHTCQKAGLSAHDWKEGALIYCFCAQIVE